MKTRRETVDETVGVGLAIVSRLWPQAPRLGASTRIACGVTSTDKRQHYTVVAGPDDRYRKCRILGYRVEVTDIGTELLVLVRMNQRHPLIKREHWSHVTCLEALRVK